MHIKHGIKTQNIRPQKNYYTSATGFKCVVRCNVPVIVGF